MTSGWLNGVVCPSSSNCGGGNIPTIVVSAADATLSNHNFTTGGNLYGILRGIEEEYGVPLLSNSASTGNGDLEPAFGPTTVGSISGTVTDSVTDADLGGATVAYVGPGGSTGSTVTAGNGTYTLSNLTPGSYTLTTSDTGYATNTGSPVSVMAGANTPNPIALTPNPGSLSGTVTDSITNADLNGVNISYTGPGGSTGSTMTSSNGQYSFSSLAEGSYSVTASIPNYTSQTNPVSVMPGTGATLTFSLAPNPGSMSGVVTDSGTGNPIVGATVSYTGPGGSTGTTKTVTDGTYSFSSLTEGSYSATASMTGYTSVTSPTSVTPGANTSNPIALTPNPGSLSGAVSDSITNADLNGVNISYTGPGGSTGSTMTSSMGTYSFSSLAEGSYSVTASIPNYTSQTNPVSVTPGTGATLSFALAPNPGSISGAVTDSVSGDPIVGATVSYTGPGGSSGSINTGTGDTYSFSSLTEGSYSVTASADTYSPQTATVGVAPGATTTQPFELVLASSVGSISGTVTDSVTDADLGGATVAYVGPGGSTGSTVTAGNGTYTLSNLTPGSYTLTTSDTGYATNTGSPVSVMAGANTPNPIALTPNPGSLSGTVTDSITNADLNGVNISYTGPGGSTGSTMTSSNGQYSFSSLAEGSYSVTASIPNYTSQTNPVSVMPGTGATLTFSLAPNPGSMSGVVTDSGTGNPIVGATVSYTGPGGSTGTTKTVTDGTYSFSSLTEGSYSATASMTGYTSVTSPTSVTPGGGSTLSFQLVSNAKSLTVVETFGTANATGGSQLVAATPNPTGSGDLLAVAIKSRVTSSSPTIDVAGISDNSSGLNTWVRATGVQSGQADEEIWYVPDSTSITSVTVTMSGTGTTAALAMTIMDISGASSTGPLDRSTAIGDSAGSGSTSPSVGPTATTTDPNEIVVGDIGWNGTPTLSGQAFAPSTSPTNLPGQASTDKGLVTSEQASWEVVGTTGTWAFSGCSHQPPRGLRSSPPSTDRMARDFARPFAHPLDMIRR